MRKLVSISPSGSKMPRRRRSSYGVRKKFKRARYTSGNQLNEAFLESEDSDCAQNLSDLLNEGFCESNTIEHVDKESQTFIEVMDSECQVQMEDEIFIGNFNVPTLFESLKAELHQSEISMSYLLKPGSNKINILFMKKMATPQ